MDRDKEKAMKKTITALTLCAVLLALGVFAQAQEAEESPSDRVSIKYRSGS